MKPLLYVLLFVVALGLGYWLVEQTKPPTERLESGEGLVSSASIVSPHDGTIVDEAGRLPAEVVVTDREISTSDGTRHSIPLEEIRQGCFGRDCIPSVDAPEFVSIESARELLAPDSIGIGLAYRGEYRFYPFPMLVTREIVNDVVAGDPLVVTYCPLCGTGIVFDREVDGKVLEFGVSGRLWQSNLLMYNRTENENDSSLWSQVLGEAVVGPDTGVKLTVVPSDIVRFAEWIESHPETLVLNTGRVGDPYDGQYYQVATAFDPSFDEDASPLPPTAYVYGLELDGRFKAYPESQLPVGTTVDTWEESVIEITRTGSGTVTFTDEAGMIIPDIEGFWFSWVSAHPETELFVQ